MICLIKNRVVKEKFVQKKSNEIMDIDELVSSLATYIRSLRV